ncbi:GNAT family N-acetyltransferase [Streptomyces sp. NPDC051976]|uniref:GNAT family N-acetyltransferase n=1 Tax=Streptomyces sp. NPDC051976 TaxID=3154947 RepID=UPI003445B715
MSHVSITVRAAAADDYPAVTDILAAAEVGGEETTLPEYPAVAVACCAQSVVGVVEFDLSYDLGRASERLEHPGKQAWIFSLAVQDVWRGRGVGAQLVRYVAQQAKADGVTLLALAVQEELGEDGSRRARFFESLGMRGLASSPGDPAWGAPVDAVLDG